MQVTYPPEFHHFALRGDLTLASSAPLLNVFLVVAGKKITEGIAKTPMIESFAVLHLARFWVETYCFCEILPLNYAPGSYRPGPLHIGWTKWGSALSNN